MELESQLVDKDLTLNVTLSAKNRIQELGFDVVNGARPMTRVIQEKIKVPLSEILLKIKKPSGTVEIDYSKKNEKFLIKILSHKKKIKLST
jgi:ATP-dependent Clp protease ATP-binding subunit ClpA